MEERSEWTAEILDSRATVPRDDDRSCPWYGFDLDAVPTSGTWPIHLVTYPSEHIDLAWYFCSELDIPSLAWVGTDYSTWGAAAAGALPADAGPSPEDCHAAALGDALPEWRIEEYSGKEKAAYGTSLCLLSNLGRLARVTFTECAVSARGRLLDVGLRISVWTRTGGGPAPTAAPEPS
ncbi:hypothetical protein [Phytomonospora endophytica]|uniref:Uncharacterized protein n=1 Tax=Phytomonospora endophytica TaxID=714109 RepID=A0A841FN72_9ACTN|nr:hypothetical protein [Phytomonospora endophytica]MBB6037485.1 hypothetical protein [Phytomonospora endophytica]